MSTVSGLLRSTSYLKDQRFLFWSRGNKKEDQRGVALREKTVDVI